MTILERPDDSGGSTGDIIAGLDADIVAVASLADWPDTRLETAARALLPEARSVVVMALEIMREVMDLTEPTRLQGAASNSTLQEADTAYLNGRLTRDAYNAARSSHRLGFKALPLSAAGCPLDYRFMEAAFSFKHAGQCAGMGKMGWHSLLIAPRFGPRLRLSVCLTEAELEPTGDSGVTFDCQSCGACVKVCPASAIATPSPGQPYSIDRFACSAYRSAAGGCSECVRVCPPGRKPEKGNNG